MLSDQLLATLYLLALALVKVYLWRYGLTVPIRTVPSKSETRAKPLRDLREVYWIEDPIESRVLPSKPAPLFIVSSDGATHVVEPVCNECFKERRGT